MAVAWTRLAARRPGPPATVCARRCSPPSRRDRLARRAALPRPLRRLGRGRARGVVAGSRSGDDGRAGPAYGRADHPQRHRPRLLAGPTWSPPPSRPSCSRRRRRPTTWSSPTRPTRCPTRTSPPTWPRSSPMAGWCRARSSSSSGPAKRSQVDLARRDRGGPHEALRRDRALVRSRHPRTLTARST